MDTITETTQRPGETIDFSELSTGERLYIWRNRKGFDQYKAAEHHGTTYRVYGKWERDEKPTTGKPKYVGLQAELTKLETCLLLRRRKGWTQRQLSVAMQRSHGWIKRLESGRSRYESSLHAFWGV